MKHLKLYFFIIQLIAFTYTKAQTFIFQTDSIGDTTVNVPLDDLRNANATKDSLDWVDAKYDSCKLQNNRYKKLDNKNKIALSACDKKYYASASQNMMLTNNNEILVKKVRNQKWAIFGIGTGAIIQTILIIRLILF